MTAPIAVALVGGALCGCHGEKITYEYHEGGKLTAAEFAYNFAYDKLNSAGCWYYGQKDGLHYLEIDLSEPIDRYDDMLNRRVRHVITKYTVPVEVVEFSKTAPLGQSEWRVTRPDFEHEGRVTYKIREGVLPPDAPPASQPVLRTVCRDVPSGTTFTLQPDGLAMAAEYFPGVDNWVRGFVKPVRGLTIVGRAVRCYYTGGGFIDVDTKTGRTLGQGTDKAE